MKKILVDWKTIENYTLEIARQISSSRWQLDYVVGITRGGLTSATLLSQWFNCPMHTLEVHFKKGEPDGCESVLWMAEDAFGKQGDRKNILVIDDINKAGNMINWVINDWQDSCFPKDSRWEDIWGNNVRFAALFDKPTGRVLHHVDYYAVQMDLDDEHWIYMPWQDWWMRKGE